MNVLGTKIKILTETEREREKLLIQDITKLEGVIDCKIDGGIVSYEISEWASDYDLMVAVMGIVEENGLECEPLFDDGDDIHIVVHKGEDCLEGEHHHEHHHEHCHEDGCECNNESLDDDACEYHGGVSCACCDGHEHLSDEESKKLRRNKLIELSISLGVLIIGLILSLIKSTKIVSDYVLIASYAIAGYEVMYAGLVGIFKGKVFSENLLMTIASIAAIMLGEVAEAAGIMLLFSIGELFEQTATHDANSVIKKLKSLSPDTVTLLLDGGETKTVSVKSVKVGDVVIIRAGEKVGVDGEIIEGSGSFDTKAVTGEGAYRDLGKGDFVYGGFISVDGTLKVKVINEYENGTVKKITEIVERSSSLKSKSEKFIEKFAKWYTPAVVIVAVLIAFIPPAFYETYSKGLEIWAYRAIMLLCVSCPCSMVISIPLTYFCGVGTAAQAGVLVKSSATLEKLADCETVVFDKTGTLTEGNLKVVKIVSTKKFQGKVLDNVAICEKYSNHPIALAIKEKVANIPDGENYKEIAGKGIECVYNGDNLVVGNSKFLNEKGVQFNESDELGMKLYLAVNGEYAGVVVLQDTIRPTARGAILELYDAGVKSTVMLTGDNKDYAVKVRKELGMKKSVSELLPEDKVSEIEAIMASCKKTTVAFVGDGINDAPVLTRADVGLAMGALGSDIAIDSADIVLSSNDLSKVPFIVKLAKRTKLISKQNAWLSLIVKFVVMILGITGLTASLWLAIGADVGVLILAILNSIRNRFKVV